MRNIIDVYNEYKISQILQLHQLRCAAVVKMICDSFDGDINTRDCVTTMLLHDMGNIIKANIENHPEMCEPEGTEYWQKVKDEYIAKYGTDEDVAHNMIAAELGVSDDVRRYVDMIGYPTICKTVESDSWEEKITQYADFRPSPFGIMSVIDRLREGHERTTKPRDLAEEARLDGCAMELEQQIFDRCSIKPEDITDESVAPIIEELRKWEI